MRGASLTVPDNLNVTGRGLSPRQCSPPSPEDAAMLSLANSSQTSLSDGELEGSEEYTVLDGVRDMNQMLVRQIETLRLKIKVDEKNYGEDKAKLVQAKESELQEKQEEVEELRESVYARDDAIVTLTRAAHEKDRTIEEKCAQIEELHGVVRQANEYAQKIQKQMTAAKRQRQKLEADPLYQQQNGEINKLVAELETLRDKLQTMEGELARAMKIIEQQNKRLSSMDEERAALHAKFREDLDRASRAMRQEVERMREVMRQNYEEMRHLREQNLEMHGDVRAIKEMLSGGGGGHAAQHATTGLPRPLTASASPAPSYARRINGHTTAAAQGPNGPGRMTGGNIARGVSNNDSRRVPNPAAGGAASDGRREINRGGIAASPYGAPAGSRNGQSVDASGYHSNRSPTRASTSINVDSSGYYSNVTTSRLSTDAGKPRLPQTLLAKSSAQASGNQQGAKVGGSGADGRSLPAICSVKEGVFPVSRQPSGRGRPGVRKGSAVAKK